MTYDQLKNVKYLTFFSRAQVKNAIISKSKKKNFLNSGKAPLFISPIYKVEIRQKWTEMNFTFFFPLFWNQRFRDPTTLDLNKVCHGQLAEALQLIYTDCCISSNWGVVIFHLWPNVEFNSSVQANTEDRI